VATILAFVLAASVGLPSAPQSVQGGAPPPVVLIVLENHSRSAVTAAAAPYLTTFAKQGRTFTHYNAIEHPSLPNYLDMVSGGDHGCRSDLCPRRTYRADNLFHQVGNWQSWEQSMTAPCAPNGPGRYAVKHNPAVFFSDLAAVCAARDIPYPSFVPATLPAFTFITPDLCHDMHDCPVRTGDNWAAAHVPELLARGAIVIITFDEGAAGSQNVYAAVRGPGVTRGVRTAFFDHFSLLAGLEDHFGVGRLGRARGIAPLPIG